MPAIFRRHVAASLLAALSLAACSGSGTSPVGTNQENIASNVLQLAVGTANIYGTSTGLNVVATYRQPHNGLHPGDSALAVVTPTFGGPSALPATAGAVGNFFSTIETGPAPIELGTHNMTGTAQTQSSPTTFGTAGTISGLGIEPYNYNNQNGVPATIVPYAQPLYDPGVCTTSSCGADPNVFVPWGGPPAFPNIRNVSNAGQLGQEEGLDVFMGVKPAAGPYTLSLTVTPQNAATFSTSKSAAIASVATVLPAITPPTPTLDNAGGGTFHAALGGGITEAYVQIVDVGPPSSSSAPVSSCNGSSGGGPTYYTVLLRAGATTGSLTDSLGVGGSPSLCTTAQNVTANPSGKNVQGDTFTVQVLAFDYPWFEASYPQSNGNPAPAIVGSAGQSDISISLMYTCSQGTALTCAAPASGSLRRR